LTWETAFLTLAALEAEPLLFTGGDFAKTDIEAASVFPV
jgi:uncharacterized protein with PIN domain